MRMRLALILLICFPVWVGAAEPENGKQLRVLCYNIHYGLGMDGEYDIPRLAEVIKKVKPDLVALQEVDVVVERSGKVHQAQELAKLTGMEVRYGPTQHYQGGLYGNAVLSHLPILDVEIQPLPYSPATEERTTYPRGAICVTVEGPNGKPLKFVSTHFQHNVEEDRVAEAKRINELFAGEEKMPVILAGDINAKPDEEPVQVLEQKWTNAMEEEPVPTAPSKNPRSRIDYIFFRANGSALALKSTEVIAEEMASDHRPVFAVFDLEKE